jgi:cell wall assembly regulator SMI1
MTGDQHDMSLTWKHCEPPVEDAILNDLEHKLGVKFPQDFRDVMKICHGGTPVERSDFVYVDPDLGPVGVSLGALLNLHNDDVEGILKTMELLSLDDQLPEGIIPFADDGGGDMMCLDYREDPGHPKVVYWAHEREKHDSIIPLADSFTEFLSMLEPPEPLPEGD